MTAMNTGGIMFRASFFLTLLVVILVICLAGCAGPRSGGRGSNGENLAGLSGKLNPEAETAFAQARILWKGTLSSASTGERCSDPEKAVALLDKAISLEPKYAEAYVRRGLAKSELGKREDAFNDASAGIRLKPTAEAYAYRALVSIRGKDVRAAQKDLDYSLKKDPKQHLARNFSGVLALTLDNMPEACAQFQQGCSAGDCSFIEAAKSSKICP